MLARNSLTRPQWSVADRRTTVDRGATVPPGAPAGAGRGARLVTTEARGSAEVNGTRLVYEVVGDGPPVVFVHGLALDRRMWDDQVAALAARHRVVRYDLRGFGESADPRAGEEYTHAADLRALLAHLNISRAALVGLSLGGWVVLEFAVTYPEAVSALVLADAVVRRYSFPHGWAANLQQINRVARAVSPTSTAWRDCSPRTSPALGSRRSRKRDTCPTWTRRRSSTKPCSPSSERCDPPRPRSAPAASRRRTVSRWTADLPAGSNSGG
jgi:pimeloyl-ACP methyl ester carboxylesterase